jgi:C-terminal processing protease CtpA/Prc
VPAGTHTHSVSDPPNTLNTRLCCCRWPHAPPPQAYRRALRRPLPAERDYLAAQFVGVGIQFGPLLPGGAGRLVLGPLAGSPAEAAGVRRGDALLGIDSLPAASLTLDETLTLLRGPVGSAVTLTVAPGGHGPDAAPRVLELERRRLPQPALREAQLPLPDGRFVQYV